MKQSGVSWLGEIPENWEVAPLKTAFTRVKRPTVSNAGIVTAFRDGEVTLRSNRRSDGYTEADDYSSYQRIMPSDLAIHSMDAFAGAIGVSDSDGICSPVLSVCVAKHGNDPRYMAYQLRLMSKRGWIEALSRSVRERTSEFRWAEAGAQKVALPPVEEQKAIADFLDRELARIDRVLENNARLVSTLKVKQRAVIWSQLRIKPQTPDRGSRYSPVFEHLQDKWPLVPFKSISKQRKSLVGDRWGSYQLLSLTRSGVITRDPESGVGKFPAEFDGYQIVEPLDLVFCLFDVAETPRTVGLVKQAGMITAAYTRYQLDRHKIDPEWLELLFIAIDDEKLFQPFYTGLRNTVPKEVLGSTLLPLPSLEEQGRIVESVKRKNQALAELMHKALDFENTLRQRRDALISSAVTGKIDVRGKN